jgi:RNA polymerase sigma-70 factor (ECF subfamily)
MGIITTHKTINTWAEQFRKGDHRAAEQLFNHFYPVIYRFTRSRLKDKESANDITQNTFLKVARTISSFDTKRGNFSSWIWQIARNTLTDHLRTIKRNLTDTASMLDISLDNIINDKQEDYSMRYDTEQVFKIVKTFHEDDQELFHLRYITELSYAEIADLTGRSENSLRVAMQRIREKIKKQYD